jgi:bacterioferritin-associated ferredoxin
MKFLLSKRKIVRRDLQTLIEIARKESKCAVLMKEIITEALTQLSSTRKCRRELTLLTISAGNV